MGTSFLDASTTLSSLNAPALRDLQGPQPSLVKNIIMAFPSFWAWVMMPLMSSVLPFQGILPPSCASAGQASAQASIRLAAIRDMLTSIGSNLSGAYTTEAVAGEV